MDNDEVKHLGCEHKWIMYHCTCSPCDWDQICIKLGTKRYILKAEKMISLLAGLKVSSLACTCVFYRPENSKDTTWK